MKKNLIVLLSVLCASFAVANGQFEKAMGKNIPAMFSASDQASLQAVINQLDRIGDAEKNRWEPYYYAAYSYVVASFQEKKKNGRDKLLDEAQRNINSAKEIDSKESEIYVLQAFMYQIGEILKGFMTNNVTQTAVSERES